MTEVAKQYNGYMNGSGTQIIFFSLFCMLSITCSVAKNVPSDCHNLRSGKYLLNMYNNTGLGHWRHITVTINRNDSSEYKVLSISASDTSFYKINWVGSCEYFSVLTNPKNKLDSVLIRMDPNGTRYKIIDIQDQYYIVRINRSGQDTIWRAK